MRNVHIHLVSDSTGETVSSVSRAALVQFEDIIPIDHTYPLIRTPNQMKGVIAKIKENPGIVMFTIVNNDLRTTLKEACEEDGIPCISVLGKTISIISQYLGTKGSKKVGQQRLLDKQYFSRLDAINYALSHDDGNATWNLKEADVVLIGASRTSKSPTCMYLANRGYKAANVPMVDSKLPIDEKELEGMFVVGLTIDPKRLIDIRKNRLLSINQDEYTNYIDPEKVKDEVLACKRLCTKHHWPMIDVTRRSIEETTAIIIQFIQKRNR